MLTPKHPHIQNPRKYNGKCRNVSSKRHDTSCSVVTGQVECGLYWDRKKSSSLIAGKFRLPGPHCASGVRRRFRQQSPGFPVAGARREVVVPLKVVGKPVGVVGGGRGDGRRLLRYHWLDGQLGEVTTPRPGLLAREAPTLVARQRLHS